MKSHRIAAALLAVGLMLSGHVSVTAQSPAIGPVREIDIPDGRIIGLSPDGSKYAVSYPYQEKLCVYDAATLEETICGSTEGVERGARLLDAVWSPDSTRLAFGEHAVDYGADSDLWVMDAQTGSIANLTDDGYAGDLPELSSPVPATAIFVDRSPAWTPDGQFLTFARTIWENNVPTGTTIAQIPAAGGNVETLVQLPGAEPALIQYETGWSADGSTFYFTVSHADSDDPDNGIWAYDAATAETHPVAIDGDPQLEPLALLEVSPTGDRLLAWYPETYNSFSVDQHYPVLIDLTTGTLSPVKPPLTDSDSHPGFTTPTFSPDGSMLLGLTSFSEGAGQLWVSDLATGTQTVLTGDLQGATVEVGRSPSWGANGNVMVSHGAGSGYLLSISGSGA